MEWLSELRRALQAEGDRPIVMTFATADAEGNPRARSVVCRRIGDDGMLWFTCDSRSEKSEQLAVRPQAEAVLWLAGSREQFRFRGRVTLHSGADDERCRALWRELSPRSRAMFYWPAPGAPRKDGAEAFMEQNDAPAPSTTFQVIILHPRAVDYLRLDLHPHERRRWRVEAGWAREALNP